MPERWERELRRLRHEEMPAGVRARAEEGARADRELLSRQRVVAAVVAFSVFLAAGAFAFQALRPTGRGPLAGDPTEPPLTEAIVTFLASDPEYPDSPIAELTVNGMTMRGQEDSYGWRNSIRDTEIPSYSDPVWLPLGSRVVIAGDADAVAGVFSDPSTRDPIQDLPLTDLDGYVMAEPGEYFLMFEAKWAPDVVPFYFPIKVRPVEPDLTDADAELAINAYPFEAVLSYGGQRAGVQETSGVWRSDGKATASGRASAGSSGESPGWARIRIPVGTSLQLSGNWEDWSNQLEPGDGRVAANDQGSLVFPPSAGTYDWRMTASWPQGQAEFDFSVELLDTAISVSPSPMEEPSPLAADVLRIRCTQEGIEEVPPTVIAQADGVHIKARSDDDPVLVLVEWYGGALESDIGSAGDEAVLSLAPGIHRIWCGVGGGPFQPPDESYVEFEVVDPHDTFVEPRLECPGGSALIEPSALADNGGNRYPEDALRHALNGLRPDDELVRVGFRDAPVEAAHWYEVQRAGSPIAWVFIGPWGGLSFQEGEACQGSGISGT